jgi:DNA-binding protein H-NS
MATKTAAKKISRVQLLKQRERIDAEIAAEYQTELQGLVEQFKAHLKTGEFELSDALALLGAGKKTRAKRGSKAKSVGDKPKSGSTYKHPKTGEEWTAPVNLRRVKKWLQELVASTGKKYEDFVAKK